MVYSFTPSKLKKLRGIIMIIIIVIENSGQHKRTQRKHNGNLRMSRVVVQFKGLF